MFQMCAMVAVGGSIVRFAYVSTHVLNLAIIELIGSLVAGGIVGFLLWKWQHNEAYSLTLSFLVSFWITRDGVTKLRDAATFRVVRRITRESKSTDD